MIDGYRRFNLYSDPSKQRDCAVGILFRSIRAPLALQSSPLLAGACIIMKIWVQISPEHGQIELIR